MKNPFRKMTTGVITGAEDEYEGLGCHCLYVFKGIITGSNRLGIRCRKRKRWSNGATIPQFSTNPQLNPQHTRGGLGQVGAKPSSALIAHAKPRRGSG